MPFLDAYQATLAHIEHTRNKKASTKAGLIGCRARWWVVRVSNPRPPPC